MDSVTAVKLVIILQDVNLIVLPIVKIVVNKLGVIATGVKLVTMGINAPSTAQPGVIYRADNQVEIVIHVKQDTGVTNATRDVLQIVKIHATKPQGDVTNVSVDSGVLTVHPHALGAQEIVIETPGLVQSVNWVSGEVVVKGSAVLIVKTIPVVKTTGNVAHVM